MEIMSGVFLAITVAVFAAIVGLDRDRAFYPTVLIVIASYYVLFAVIGGSPPTTVAEILVMVAFSIVAVAGFRSSLWWVVVGLCAHGLFDFTRGPSLDHAGVPPWWPSFCLGYDVAAAAGLGFLLRRGETPAASPGLVR